MAQDFKHSAFVVALVKIGKLLHPLSVADRRRLLEHFSDELTAREEGYFNRASALASVEAAGKVPIVAPTNGETHE
jgi:hypothetical protein